MNWCVGNGICGSWLFLGLCLLDIDIDRVISDDVQDFDTRWDQILLGTSGIPPENVLESVCKNKLQSSEQRQTVFAVYNQELNRDHVTPSYLTLRKMVRQHIDKDTQFQAQNEKT